MTRPVGHSEASGHVSEAMRGYADKLLELTRLDPNWDTYGGRTVSVETVAAVGAFLRNVIDGKVSIVPMSDGGVQVCVYADGWEVDISFEAPKEGEPMHEIEGVYERART